LRRRQSDSGSAPLETAALLTLLLLPVTPMLQLFSVAFDQIAAESIARHALRYSILHSSEQSIRQTAEIAVDMLASRWGRNARFDVDCGSCSKGSLVVFKVYVGDASATQVAGLEPR
jgi:hypothetical protein